MQLFVLQGKREAIARCT